jgi:peroxidase
MGLMLMKMIQALAKMMGLNLNQAQQTFEKIPFANSVTGSCPKKVTCFESKYRTLDGSCNNQQNPDWGQSFTAYNRMLVPEYEDNFDAARVTGLSGQALPSARLISTTISAGSDPSSRTLTLMAMQWGQFLDHDLTSTATSRSEDGRSLKCCGPEFDADPSLLHPACFPIPVPSDDPFYTKESRTCMSFVRSAAAPRINCAFGPREQMNQLPAYIDASMVYGKSEASSSQVRSFQNGMLRTSVVDGQNFLPQSTGSCGIPQERRQKCFIAGDGRVNVQANLVVIHALFVRNHNSIADQLQQLNPNWIDETLFQETRRIVAAQIQHITYNEFLPVVLGQTKMNELGIKVTDQGYSNTYDPNTNAQILSAFSTAAYRMHTLIPKTIDFVDSSGSMVGKIDLSESYFNPSVLYEKGAFGRLTNGLVTQSASDFDPLHTDQISNHLFRPFGAGSGLDLVALNIQRGRDHGLPGYNRFRTSCGLPAVSSWDQMMNVMKRGAGQALQSLYSSPDDVDLYVGGISEKAVNDGLVGPTFACIIGEQFKRLRNGDRFWYENGGQSHSFSPQQLSELKKTSLSAILCDVGTDTTAIQPFSLTAPNNDWNQRVDCRSLSRPDFTAWANEPA